MLDLFGRKYKRLYDCMIGAYSKLKAEKQLSDIKKEQSENIINNISSIISEHKYEILSIEYNKKINDYVIVYIRNDVGENLTFSGKESFDVYIKTLGYKQLRNKSEINFFVDLKTKEKSFYIVDIQTGGNTSKGFGAIAMDNLIKLAKRWDILCIYGDRYFEDEANKLRQEKYYGDRGFEVTEHTIRLNLKK
ncbi:hypothetical protein COM59_24140 [Bacillus pseudomycoides]|uniref:hypothetical protein n=1 Tax=Bacillus pseudomycoides TaxID=64104 RepID=UPI000BF784C9|nr:hypothetical protein [Bacillus pseudomycoides]PGF06475.1 hypothetical protein COM59_24140 [Bacillus pseudomycoides]